MEPISAFSVYETECKNTEQLSSEKKKKKKLQRALNRKQKDVKQTSVKQQIQDKGIKSTRKLNSVNNRTPSISKINNVRIMHRKLQLKAMREHKKKSKKNLNKRKTILMTDAGVTENNRTGSSENDLNIDSNHTSHSNNTSIEMNEKYGDVYRNPCMDSHQLLQWLLCPMHVETFLEQNWENTPMYVKRDTPDYYKSLVSTPLLDEVLRKNHIQFTKNIDITSYSNGVRETHNPPGRALPSVVWDYYRNKCSVRMLNPQTFIPTIHALNATLQEFFNCFVGANLYLTPPNSQGFAPHYDDVEAFILQVEGQKRWKLYKPLNANEYLPRYSSKNFDQSEIGEPILDTIVKAGDLLYLPRGTIHQGMTLGDTHSLHVTLSVYQKNSWCDFLEKLLPQALKQAAENDVRFREGLPLDCLTYVGTAHSEGYRKDVFKNKVKDLITLMLDHIDIDNAADLMAKSHIHDFLPPFVFKSERKCTVMEDGEVMTSNGLVKNHAEITLETKIRLLRLHCIRLIKEDTYKIYYSTENSKEYHEYEPQFLEVDEEFVSGIKQMIAAYPEFISVKKLLIETDDAKIQIVKDLWEKGLISTEDPLC